MGQRNGQGIRRGDLDGYRALVHAVDEIGQNKVQAKVLAQVLLHRAEAEWILGRLDHAREAVGDGLRLAKASKMGRLIIDADKILALVENPKPAPQRPAVSGTGSVRGNLRVLRATLSC